MKIEKDESGNMWIDGELCINVPVRIKYFKELQRQDYENIVNLIDNSIYYYIHGSKIS